MFNASPQAGISALLNQPQMTDPKQRLAAALMPNGAGAPGMPGNGPMPPNGLPQAPLAGAIAPGKFY